MVADTLAPSVGKLAGEATDAILTPDELKKKALDLGVNDVLAPFLHAGSETLGGAVAGALAQRTGLKENPTASPSAKAVAQVRVALKTTLITELKLMPNLRVVAEHAGLKPEQVAAELAGVIAQDLANDLADGLVRLPSSSRLDDPAVIAIVEQVTEQQLPHKPPLTVAYTVQPGDSLWDLSQQLLGPGATDHEIEQIWQLIYRDNRTTIGTNPNRLVPGQVLRIPSTGESALSQGWVLLPWLVVGPGILTGLASRRRRRSDRAKERRPAAQAEVKVP